MLGSIRYPDLVRSFFYVTAVLLVASNVAVAQTLITGRIIDKETKKPIRDVSISRVGTTITTTSNALGFFQLEGGEKMQLKITAGDAYISATVDISGKENVTIALARRMFIRGAPVLTPPTFPGGDAAFVQFISKNINVSGNLPKGVVVVEILIDSTGSVIQDSVRVVESSCIPCNRAALRVMKKSPKWIPGEQKSNMKVRVPITFQ